VHRLHANVMLFYIKGLVSTDLESEGSSGTKSPEDTKELYHVP
jgi:hypothetical protein